MILSSDGIMGDASGLNDPSASTRLERSRATHESPPKGGSDATGATLARRVPPEARTHRETAVHHRQAGNCDLPLSRSRPWRSSPRW